MAESVKRRVAAARLAVAFVAAGTIAGASAWASASPPPPLAQTSATAKGEHIKKAILTVRHSDQVVNGSLLFEDFKKGEIVAFKEFQKVEIHLKKQDSYLNKSLSSIKGEVGDIKSQIDGIKGEISGIKGEISSIKGESSSYLKVTDDVMRGDGSVLTASAAVGAQKVVLLDAPGMFTVDATGSTVTLRNTSGAPLSHTSCKNGQGTLEPAGTLAAGGTLSCDVSGGTAQTLQVIGGGVGGGPHVAATVNVSQIPAASVGADPTITVQILIGL
jgi:hypothetical protein